jgi:acetyl-CoA C-acetyltransferase
MTTVFILGGYQSDFARNYAKEGLEISDIVAEVVDGTLEASRTDADDIETIHVGNAFGELFVNQGHLGAMPATVTPSLWGKPAARHEAACASGSIAVLAAMAEIEAGRYDKVLVVGAEQERNVPGRQAAEFMGSAAWTGHEAFDGTSMWAWVFSRLAEEYARRFGLSYEHLARIAELNVTNAAANPRAQTRAWGLQPEVFGEDDHLNPLIEPWVRRNDCGKVTDGGAGVVLASEKAAAEHVARIGGSLDELPRIEGWGHATSSLQLDETLRRSADQPHVLPHVRQAVVDAWRRAGVADVSGLDGVETHDCFSISEYVAIDHFGLTEPGESWKAVENGDIERGGSTPVNPSGGLIGGGHPVGATGIRMVLDASRQVTGAAGDYQVEGARRFATLNIGGSATTAVSFVVGR